MFKVGDKVKLTGHFCGVFSNDIGEVVSIGPYIYVSWNGILKKKLGVYPHKVSEIEYGVKVGEQLTFNFMKGD